MQPSTDYPPQPQPQQPAVFSTPMTPAEVDTGGRKKRTLLLVVGVLLLGIIAAFSIWLVTRDNSTHIGPPAATITITDESGFVPSTIKIKQGQSVQWVNESETEHRVAADESVLKTLDSQDALQKKESYTYPFDEKGKFPYFDPLNPDQYVGTIIVE